MVSSAAGPQQSCMEVDCRATRWQRDGSAATVTLPPARVTALAAMAPWILQEHGASSTLVGRVACLQGLRGACALPGQGQKQQRSYQAAQTRDTHWYKPMDVLQAP